jgi:AcrR family transcriptional regulator
MTEAPPLRRDQATAVRERILAAALEVIEAGEEPTMRAVAKAAEVSERTVYRYFAARDELFTGLVPIIRERASAPMAACADGLPDYVRRLFSTFDRNAQLARALATAAWVPTRVSRPANLRALGALVDAAFPEAPRADRVSAAATLRALYSAAGWAYLTDCGFGLEESVRHVQWLTRAVMEKLKRDAGGNDA